MTAAAKMPGQPTPTRIAAQIGTQSRTELKKLQTSQSMFE
jgi:hypothetical protein